MLEPLGDDGEDELDDDGDDEPEEDGVDEPPIAPEPLDPKLLPLDGVPPKLLVLDGVLLLLKLLVLL